MNKLAPYRQGTLLLLLSSIWTNAQGVFLIPKQLQIKHQIHLNAKDTKDTPNGKLYIPKDESNDRPQRGKSGIQKVDQ